MDATFLYLQTTLGFLSSKRGFDSLFPLHIFNKLAVIACLQAPLTQ